MYTVENTKGIMTFLHMVKSAGTSVHQGIVQSSTGYRYKVHVNQRHASIKNLPEKYKENPRIIALRRPEDWYISFYRFFLNVEGYMSFMLTDPLPANAKGEIFLDPLSIDEFVRRSINLKDTLERFPNKARVFRNMLRSQSNLHFITGYFESDFHVDDPDTMQQFDCSLFEWFWRGAGGEEAFNIPMDRLDIIEDLFEIKIPHANKTPSTKPKQTLLPETIELIRETHKDFYSIIEDFNDEELYIKLGSTLNLDVPNTQKEIV